MKKDSIIVMVFCLLLAIAAPIAAYNASTDIDRIYWANSLFFSAGFIVLGIVAVINKES